MTDSKFQIWIHALRLRTLPLALGSVILGSFLAEYYGRFRIEIFLLIVTTALLLQILANLANDYGDSVQGADNENRIGPVRAVQSGIISKQSMLFAIIFTVFLSISSGLLLIHFSIGAIFVLNAMVFAFIGGCAIIAAILYTIGKNPYGYAGFGDLFVFIFFGLVGTLGSFFLYTMDFQWPIFLPATSIGLLSVGVLNINNIRDSNSDKLVGKHTIAVRLGFNRAKIYQCWLMALAGLFSILSIVILGIPALSIKHFLFLIVFPFLFKITKGIYGESDPVRLDPYLKQVSILTLIFSILFGISINV
jgi:1,4-dihydroxy-2-naphthoate octaprenyltransferase